jgi:hypothetical protein
MPKFTVTFRAFDYIKGPPAYGHFTTGDGPGNTPEDALAAAKQEYPSGSDFRVFELVEVTPKPPKHRYVVDVERDSSYDPYKKIKEAIVFEAESVKDAALMARQEFGPGWKVVDVSYITSMKFIVEDTDVLG